jgi:hypothetical protein
LDLLSGVPVTCFIMTLSEITSRLAKSSLSFHRASHRFMIGWCTGWVVSGILGSVGHKVKIHKITPSTGKERGDLEIKDYVVLQKPQEQTDRLPPPRTLILDFTMTHTSYGRSHVHSIGQLTNTRSSNGDPEPDGVLRVVTRKKMMTFFV